MKSLHERKRIVVTRHGMCIAALVALLLIFHTTGAVSAGCVPSKGTSSDDNIACSFRSPLLQQNISGRQGNDTIRTWGWVKDIRGDNNGNGASGDDQIVITRRSSAGDVYGDVTNAKGGDDTIIVFGSAQGITGDGQISTNPDSGNDSIIVRGRASGVSGDGNRGKAGNDIIKIAGYANSVGGDTGLTFSYDPPQQAGHDLILIKGITRYVYGDHGFARGNDTLKVWGIVEEIQGDGSVHGFGGPGGNDLIQVFEGGYVARIRGDRTQLAGGNDTIVVFGDAGEVVGDDNYDRVDDDDLITIPTDDGGNDSIRIWGTAERVYGDKVIGENGNDIIKISGFARLVYGDGSDNRDARGNGGNDNIIIDGTTDSVVGDNVRNSGGDDTITISKGGIVSRDVIGDSASNNGGADLILIWGTVEGNVIGDQVGGMGGIDTIKVLNSGKVQGDVVGDDAGTPANAGNGGDDVFVINGTVDGTVYLDNVGGPTLDVVGNTAAIDVATGGNDVIVVAGQITGGISSATGSDGDDVFVIADGGGVGGVMDGGAHVEGDSLIFDLSTWSKGEYNDLAELFEGLSIEDGTVRYRGNRYQWVNFEVLDYFIQLFQKRTVPLRCGGVYKLNDEGTACEAYGQEAQDAITFHRNNPGYDGRMPGTEACAIYNYGNAMRVYEVVDGAEGELVTTISADVFNQEVASNVLLASSASGHVQVYYLTSNEVQVECKDYTGKTQVRIIPDFSGTVNASFDKDA